MNVSVPSAPLPVRVLFLSRDESFVRTDTKLLRSLGVSAITHVSQSSQATAFLEKHPPKSDEDATLAAGAAHPVDIVISDEHLADAPASVFLYGLAKHPALKSQPVRRVLPVAGLCRRGADSWLAEICVVFQKSAV